MSEIKVNSIKGVGASAAAITVNNTDGTCTANITNNLSNRRLTINGDMRIAQRGASNTAGGNGYYTVDRIVYYNQGIDNDVTKAQVDIAAGTTPYTLGFRKAFKLTNGNQSSGAGAADIIEFGHKIEAQDIANSGWNYTDPNSKITLSFWCKSSVAQNFNFFLVTSDGTAQSFPYETGSLSADTWTKITKTIAGNSNLQFDNNNEQGLSLMFPIFYGTNFTGSTNLNQWNTHSGSARTPDQTSTWYTTNGATFEITGVQLEVGSVATDFEFRSFGQELALCKRYYQQYPENAGDNYAPIANGRCRSSTQGQCVLLHPSMRSAPSFSYSGDFDFRILHGGSATVVSSFDSPHQSGTATFLRPYVSSGMTLGHAMMLTVNNNANTRITLSAEL